YLAANHVRAFAHGHHGVVTRIVPLVAHHEFGQLLRIERDFGDEGPIDTSKVGTYETGLAAVSPEQFDHRDSYVRAGAGPKLVYELNAASDCGAESYAVVRSIDVVVHRLRYGDDLDSLCVKALAVAQSVVASDWDQRVHPKVFEDAKDVRREVARPRTSLFCLRVFGFEEYRLLFGPHLS